MLQCGTVLPLLVMRGSFGIEELKQERVILPRETLCDARFTLQRWDSQPRKASPLAAKRG